MTLQAPFPWFGGKSRIAHLVWERFGADVPNYVEPFFGSGAVLLGRPGGARGIETVNDKDGFVCNAWRAIQTAPDETAGWADWPVNENDLHARHIWLRARREALSRRLEADPEYHDAQIAGWWLWGMACWIGGGFCGETGSGPWQVVDGQLVHLDHAGQGVTRSCAHLGPGRGVQRRRVHLSPGQGVQRRRVQLGGAYSPECGVNRRQQDLAVWFRALQNRLRRVRVCCGDWLRILGETPTVKQGTTAIFLDPPYALDERDGGCYNEDTVGLSVAVRAWALAHGDDPRYRIVLCGYEGEYQMPESWEKVAWSTGGGYAKLGHTRGRENRHRERLWCSPHCLQTGLFTQITMVDVGVSGGV